MAWIYKLRVCLITTAAVMLILLAVVFTALRAVLPYATDYVVEIQNELSKQIGLPVVINSIDADMSWFTPRLKLIGLTILGSDGEKELLHLDEAIFALSYIDSLLNLSPNVGEIYLVGADLYIERHPDGKWVFQGIEHFDGGTVAPSSELMSIIQNTNFSLVDSDVHWKDFTGITDPMDFIGVNLTFESFLGEHSLAMDMQLPEGYGDSFQLIATINDDLQNARTAEWDIYFEGQTINIANWLSRLDLKGLPRISGTFDGELWFNIKNKILTRATGEISINSLSLVNSKVSKRQWQTDYFSSKFDWLKSDNNWQFNASDLIMVKNNAAWAEKSDVIIGSKGGSGLSVSATYIRPHDFSGLAGVFLENENDLSEVENIQSMYLGGDLYNVDLYVPDSGKENVKAAAVFTDIDFKIAGQNITARGMDGEFKFIDDQLKMIFVSEEATVDFGELFPKPVAVDLLTGELIARKQEGDWIFESTNIDLVNADIETRSRVNVIVGADSKVLADIQTDFKNARGASARNYYPQTVMDKELINWLNMGITDGVVPEGSFILHGDISQFPYVNNDGVMEVTFAADDLTMHFYKGWPAIQKLTADVRFHNSSMSVVNGTGMTYAGSIRQATASIPDLNQPYLYVDGEIEATAQDLQKYIWNSGLNDVLGETMNQMRASGDVDLKLSLEISLLDGDDTVKTKGKLKLEDNKLYFPSMGYTFSHITGDLLFTEDSLSSENIDAVFENVPVKIKAGHNHDQYIPEIIFNITGKLPADGLLKKFTWIPDYWISGSSDWDISIHIPDVSEDYLVRIDMRSSLEGVDINLSDALSKPKAATQPVEIIMDILDDGLEIDATSKDALTLFASRDIESNWDLVIDSKYVKGKGEFVEGLNKDSIAKLDMEHISLLKLFYSSNDSTEKVALKPTIFPSLDFTADNLDWDKWQFKNVKLKTNWNAHGMLIDKLSLEGPSLKVDGRGSWLSTWKNDNETNFKFFVSSSDLGHTLTGLNLGNSITRGEQVATVDWQWAAEPYRFSLAAVRGSAHVELSNGEVTNLQPGAGGRILGLFNVFKLGDRLTLNFNDVYKEGFSFDSIVGDFEFNVGDAYTENVEVKAPAADMKMSGRVGIVKHDYDLTMLVKPHDSEALFTGGTIAGGPGLGAAVVVIYKMLGLEDLSRDKYEVTGSWDDPVVKLVSKRTEETDSKKSQKKDDYGDDDGF